MSYHVCVCDIYAYHCVLSEQYDLSDCFHYESVRIQRRYAIIFIFKLAHFRPHV